jgi:hypothetical protein
MGFILNLLDLLYLIILFLIIIKVVVIYCLDLDILNMLVIQAFTYSYHYYQSSHIQDFRISLSIVIHLYVSLSHQLHK